MNNARSESHDAWDVAFSDVMLAQQNQIADLLAKIEQFTQNDMPALDARNAIRALREQQVLTLLHFFHNGKERSTNETRRDREALIQEFQHTIKQLLRDFRNDFGYQAHYYDRKLSSLQVRISSPV